jgi:magnesium transporter
MSLQPYAPAPSPPAPLGPNRVVNCVLYSTTGQRLRDITLDEISDVLAVPGSFVWVGLYEPDATLLRKMQEEFGLHELAIEDAQHAHQRAKIEVYGDTLFVVVHTAQFVSGEVEFGETHLFVGPRFLLSVRHGASLSYAPARARCEQTPALLAQGPSFGLYAVLDYIVDNFMPIVSGLQAELRELEEDIFEDEFKRETIERLYHLKRELVSLRLAVNPMQDIVNQLVRFHPGIINDATRVYFRDVYDHTIRIGDSIGSLSEMLTAALQVNLSMVTVGQNESVKRLAGWAGLLAIPTVVFSNYGMNFEHMPELKWPQAYPVTLLITLVLILIVYRKLKKAKWL